MAPMRRLTLDLDLDQVSAIVHALDVSWETVGVTRLHGGSTEVYRIDVAGHVDPLVLKIYGDEPAWAPAKEALVAGWINDRLPIPRWLRVDESRTVLPLRYALTTWLPGRTLRSSVSDPDIEAVYRQAGAMLRRVHAISMSAYGYIVADGVLDPRSTHADYMGTAFEQLFRSFRDKGGDPDLARRLQAIVHERSDVLAESAGPVLCHDDFHQGNLLAARGANGSLRLTGLIDFGNARAGDALFDLAKALFCSAHEDPRSREPLLAGYGGIDHADPSAALWLYTLYHRLSMWTWLTGLGDDPNAEGGPGGLLRDLAAMSRQVR
jgi:aminoglycoside phosphotransferase (APT) family kinase protein